MPPTASLDHRFNPGDKLAGRYRIVSLIGEGAIGEVYEAFDEALAEPLALKTLRAQVASQAVTVERFRREIQLARKVTHRNVCRTYDLGRHEMPDGAVVMFLTMELLRGISLDRYMRGRGRLTTSRNRTSASGPPSSIATIVSSSPERNMTMHMSGIACAMLRAITPSRRG